VEIRIALPKMEFVESASQTVLDEIVGEDRVTSQSPRITAKPRDLGLDPPMSIGHENLPMLAAIGPRANLGGAKAIPEV
jgi:hypothetical protein